MKLAPRYPTLFQQCHGLFDIPTQLIRKGYNVNAQWRDQMDWERVLITATMRDKSVETLLQNIQIPFPCVPPPCSPKSMLHFRPSSLPVLKQYNVDFGKGGGGGGGFTAFKQNEMINEWNCLSKRAYSTSVSTTFVRDCSMISPVV